MALEFICYNEITHGGKISIPDGANYYSLKSGIIRFFHVNPVPVEKMIEIPIRAERISFTRYKKHTHWTYYGDPTFYSGGNVLKDSNGIMVWTKE